ncbi:hypothetical protein VTN77DRAFT_3098 [Rasamsonia byssochlamydoides]|uniref:uncharacterized protein n=1 Tax=Rasamsonia byssochlamydoides TaxID=89139 RepID=UPI0037435B62
MATPAQCYYCFECLSASFKNQEPPSLAAVEELWEQYEQAKELALLKEKTIDAEEESDVDEDDQDDQNGEDGVSLPGDRDRRRNNRPRTIKLPGIKRLQQDLPSDSSSSTSTSTSTTPSTLSAHSSRSALSNSTAVTSPLSQPSPVGTPSFRRPKSYPLFVTWNTISKSGHKSLRGCIGTFEAHELSHGLRTYALTSAFDDTRFSPIPASLLPSLSCSLTLLSDFEPCADAMDWELGTHGLRISFIYRNRRYGATYLPDVAVEQRWTKEETVESLMRKAGWDGGSNSGGGITRKLLRGANGSSSSTVPVSSRKPWNDVSDFKAIRYQGLKATASYAEWQEWRKWVKSDEARRKLLETSR